MRARLMREQPNEVAAMVAEEMHCARGRVACVWRAMHGVVRHDGSMVGAATTGGERGLPKVKATAAADEKMTLSLGLEWGIRNPGPLA